MGGGLLPAHQSTDCLDGPLFGACGVGFDPPVVSAGPAGLAWSGFDVGVVPASEAVEVVATAAGCAAVCVVVHLFVPFVWVGVPACLAAGPPPVVVCLGA